MFELSEVTRRVRRSLLAVSGLVLMLSAFEMELEKVTVFGASVVVTESGARLLLLAVQIYLILSFYTETIVDTARYQRAILEDQNAAEPTAPGEAPRNKFVELRVKFYGYDSLHQCLLFLVPTILSLSAFGLNAFIIFDDLEWNEMYRD